MKKKLMISRKIFIAFMIIVEIMFVGIAVAFYTYNIITLTNSETVRLASLCASTSSQLDTMIHSMDELSLSIANTDGFVASMKQLSQNENPDAQYFRKLNEIISKSYSYKASSVYRVVALTQNGNSVCYGRNELDKAEIAELVATGYFHQSDRRGNSKVMIGPLSDPFVKEEPAQLFSLLRAVRDGDELLGYIEVQMLTTHINEIYQNRWSYNDLYFAILNNEGEVFLSNFDPDTNRNYIDTIMQNSPWYPTDSIETPKEFVCISNSNYTDWKVSLIMPKSVMYSPLRGLLPMWVVFSIVLGLVITYFFWLIIERITKPIEKVVAQVKEITLENVDEPFEVVSGSYESEVLSDTFHTMKDRLSISLRKEKAINHMQTKTLLESLQSRIGPHFLYNTLGSIANMCETGDSQSAANACFDLSDLLRYSSSYDSGLVTIKDELLHLENYLSLMKCRYQHRLNYNISAAEDCLDSLVLKLTIQPIVENAIKYSLITNEKVNVGVKIYAQDDDVYIEVSDNGSGFSKDVIQRLDETIQRFQIDRAQTSLMDNLPKRGMGLSGTLMRLYLLFGEEQFRYKIENNEPCGATVTLIISVFER